MTPIPEISMKGIAYCTASAYNIKALHEMLRDRYATVLYREVLQLTVSPSEGEGFVCFFTFGALVCWNMAPEQAEKFALIPLPVQETPVDPIEKDDFTYSFGDAAKIVKDEIVLPNSEPGTLLAVSFAIGRSVKLSALETALQRTLNLTQHIPTDLLLHGKVELSRNEIRRMMGQLFLERNSIALQCDVLDIPEFFWENIESEPLYLMVAHHFDLEKRVKVLNQRLTIVHDLFNMLGNEINHLHSSRLEWIIIILIVIEVIFSILRDIFHIL